MTVVPDEAVPWSGARGPGTGARVAYLVSHYPTLSHAFIEREVAALRDLGAEVQTWSVRPSRPQDQLSGNARAEAARTRTLLGRRPLEYLTAHVSAAIRAPGGWTRALRSAATAGPGGARSRLWQFFYLTEAAVLLADLRRAGLDHVHVHFANNGADVARLAVALAGTGPRARRLSWTFSMHGPTEFADPVGHDLADKLRSAAAVACISEFCREELLALVDPHERAVIRDRTALVRMGVDSDRYPPGGRARLGRRGPLHLLFVGRLVSEKGPELLVQAAAGLRGRGVDVQVSIVGEGPLGERLTADVARLGLGDHVHLLGARGQDDLPELYARADVFCLPSFAEGVPAVLMEAMSTELPVVTTRIAGIPELVQDRESGLLCEPGDVEGLEAAIVELAASPELRLRMGQRGRERVLQEFGTHRNAERLLVSWERAGAQVGSRA